MDTQSPRTRGIRGFRYGRSYDSIHRLWSSMKARCNNPRHIEFPNYGGRGIKVCDRWNAKHGFEAFLEDMGERPPGMSIERKNNNLGYSKENCVWADDVTQHNNTRGNHLLTFEGRTQTVAQWARELNLNYVTLISRVNYGWSAERALTTPIGKYYGGGRKKA